MRLCVIFFLIFVFSSCSCNEKTVTNTPRRVAGTVYFDSLKSTGPDHLISFASKCIGCTMKSETIYYLWESNGQNHTTKIQDSVLYELKTDIELDRFAWMYDSILHEKWNLPQIMVSHYHYDEFTADFKSYHLEYRITESEEESNKNSYRVRFISVMDSVLKETKPSDWQTAF